MEFEDFASFEDIEELRDSMRAMLAYVHNTAAGAMAAQAGVQALAFAIKNASPETASLAVRAFDSAVEGIMESITPDADPNYSQELQKRLAAIRKLMQP